MTMLQTRLRWRQLLRAGRAPQLHIAVLASFTANPIEPYLGVALEEAGLPADIWIGPYNQIVQECLSPNSQLAQHQPDMLIVWPRLEELWRGRPLPLSDPPASYADAALEVADAALAAARSLRSTLVLVLPAIPELRPLGVGDSCTPNGVFAVAAATREALRQRLAGQRGVLLVDSEESVRQLGSRQSYNTRLFAVTHIPFSEELFSALGGRLARTIALSRRAARKLLVLDADNTLWGGVVGEVGAEGIDLSNNGPGEAYCDFQEFLLELRRQGVLLALCSKNNEADVWQAFARREMRLQREHLAAWRINWQAKSANLRAIASELGLGVDSFVFIDDSPAELAEVQSALPEVATIRMPADPGDWLGALQDSGVLDWLPPTADDLQRTQQYAAERQRKAVQGQGQSPEEYLARLDVRVRIFAPQPADMPRLGQLVMKTNQFNLNGRRHSDSELADLAASPDTIIRMAHVQDRFGDYGLVGAFILLRGGASATLDTFVLSCRAMGRGVEAAMAAELFDTLAPWQIANVEATPEECPRNEPARSFFAALGCAAPGVPARLQRPDWPAYVTRL